MEIKTAPSSRSIFTPDLTAALAAGKLSDWVIDEIKRSLAQLEFMLECILPEPLRIDEQFLVSLAGEEGETETDGHPFDLATIKDTKQLRRRLGEVALQAIYLAEWAACAGTDEEAVDFVTRSTYNQAFIDGAASMHAGKIMLSEFARKGAKAAKAEYADMKSSLFRWLDDNFHNYRSVDSAAQQAVKIEPIGYRTAVTWINEWKALK